MRVFSLLLIAVAAIAQSPEANAQRGPALNSPQWASTTRIETEPVYGAVVTYESGVRIFRPIPPTQHLIINPDGQTPLFLGFGRGDGSGAAGPGVMNQQLVAPGFPRRRGIQTIPAVE